MNNWLYGDSWEKYPIEPGEIWRDSVSQSMVSVNDIRDGIPGFIQHVDLMYTDPPWNQGNANSFVTKAGLERRVNSFEEFMWPLFDGIMKVIPEICYLEIGAQYFDEFVKRLSKIYPVVQQWGITYYRRNPSFLIRGGFEPTDLDFAGMDDADTPVYAIEHESCNTVADICMGRGLTGISALKFKKQFFGCELNKRRLAVFIEKSAKMGARWEH